MKDDPHEHEHGHGHGHGHTHDHHPDHAPGHDHAHHHHAPNSAPSREDLPRGAGLGKLLFLDAPSGLAGDMVIAALIDLGVPSSVIAEAAAALPISGFHIHFGTAVKSGIVGTKLDVHVDGAQPERTYATVRAILDDSSLSPRVRELAHATFRRLAEAEAKVHRSDLDSVHFHEVGAIDALVDVVGSAAAIDWLAAEIVVSPLPMGRGFVKARHGILPLPPPATVECLRGVTDVRRRDRFRIRDSYRRGDRGAHARGSARWPAMAPERVGWGAGTANLKDRPNLLRAILGAVAAEGSHEADTHVVIEANLDDATGELVGEAIASLLAEGALDAWATPVTMKRGAPPSLSPSSPVPRTPIAFPTPFCARRRRLASVATRSRASSARGGWSRWRRRTVASR